MSALLVFENGEILTAWQGGLPQEGDVIWLEESRKLLRVTTVVHVVGLHSVSGSTMSVAYPTSMQRIFVEDMTGDRGTKELVSVLKALKAAGV